MATNYFASYQQGYANADNIRHNRQLAQQRAEQHEANMRYTGLQSDALEQRMQQLEHDFQLKQVYDFNKLMGDAVAAHVKGDSGFINMVINHPVFGPQVSKALGGATQVADTKIMDQEYVRQAEELGAELNPNFTPLWLQTPKGPVLHDMNMMVPFINGAADRQDIQEMLNSPYKAIQAKGVEGAIANDLNAQIKQYEEGKLPKDQQKAFIDLLLENYKTTAVNSKGAEDAKNNAIAAGLRGDIAGMALNDQIKQLYQGKDFGSNTSSSAAMGGDGTGAGASNLDPISKLSLENKIPLDKAIPIAESMGAPYIRSIHQALGANNSEEVARYHNKGLQEIRNNNPELAATMDVALKTKLSNSKEPGIMFALAAANNIASLSDKIGGLSSEDVGALDDLVITLFGGVTDAIRVTDTPEARAAVEVLGKDAVNLYRGYSNGKDAYKGLLNLGNGYRGVMEQVANISGKAISYLLTVAGGSDYAVMGLAPKIEALQKLHDISQARAAVFDIDKEKARRLTDVYKDVNGRDVYVIPDRIVKPGEDPRTKLDMNYILVNGKLKSLASLNGDPIQSKEQREQAIQDKLNANHEAEKHKQIKQKAGLDSQQSEAYDRARRWM